MCQFLSNSCEILSRKIPANFISSSLTTHIVLRSTLAWLAVTQVCQTPLALPGSLFGNLISKACGPFADIVCQGRVAQLLDPYCLAPE